MEGKNTGGQRLDSLFQRIEEIQYPVPVLQAGGEEASHRRSKNTARPSSTDEDKRAILEQARLAREESKLLHKQYAKNRERFLALSRGYKY